MPEAAGLYYEVHGRDDAPPLILSSGLGGSADYWTPNLRAFAAHFRTIVYDHRGTGRSDRALPEGLTVAHLAADIVALMDALGIAKAHVVGHAAGGAAGLSLALTAPKRLGKLVVVNGWVRPDPHFLRCFAARLALLRDSGPEAYLRAQPIFLYPADWISLHTAELDAELPHQVATFPGVTIMERRIAALAAFDVVGKLRHLTNRVFVLVNLEDMLVPSVAGWTLSRELGGAHFEAMANGGHACNVTDPGTFNRLVLDFLRS